MPFLRVYCFKLILIMTPSIIINPDINLADKPILLQNDKKMN